jgi:hypothetical protein
MMERSSLDEKLINNPSKESFNVQIINPKNVCFKAVLTVDKSSKQVVLVTLSGLTLPINNIDVLGIVKEHLNDDKSFTRSKDIIAAVTKDDKVVAALNYFPNQKVRSCNIFGIICCKCFKVTQERKMKVNNFLKFSVLIC